DADPASADRRPADRGRERRQGLGADGTGRRKCDPACRALAIRLGDRAEAGVSYLRQLESGAVVERKKEGVTLSIRHCERSEAIHLSAGERWIASSQALLAMTDKESYPFGNFAFSAYNASSASRGDISSGCSAFTASTSSSASLGGAGSAAAREGTANSGRSSASAFAVWPRSWASSFDSTDLARAITAGGNPASLAT